MLAASTPKVTSARSPGLGMCSTLPASVSNTTRPLAPAPFGLSANENESVEPAYHVRFETFCWTW
jgi:hypothetical protein